MNLTKRNITNTNYYIKQYNDRYFRIYKIKYERDKGWELKEKLKSFLTESQEEKKERELENIRKSLSRTKSKIRELALCNNFEYFGTITINGYFLDRYELNDCQNKLKQLLKKIKRNNTDFKYLIITEKHKDNAFHFHGLFSGIDLYKNEFGYYSNELFSNNLGYNSFIKINHDYIKVCNYITKYITKDCVKNSNNQVFIRSANLVSATKEKLNNFEINWKYDNDFISIYDLDLDNLTDYDKNVVLKLMGVDFYHWV